MVQSRVEDLSTVVKKLSVELAPEQVKEVYDRAVQGLSRTVKLKGYRVGHVPRRMVERFFGDDLRRDVAQKLVQGSIFEAMEQHKLVAVAPPRVENGEVAADAPFKYVATVEVRPVVEVKEYAGLAAPKADGEVADAEVEERLQQLRKEHSQFVPVEGRDIVEPGDYVVTDYEGFVAGAPLKGAKREGVMLEAVPGSLLENKAEALVGAKVGETRELGVTFPADYQVEELRNKDATFTAKVQGLKKRQLPELDDAFALELGGAAKTLAELKETMKKDMAAARKERAESDQREKLLESLVAANPIEAPPALVERNVDAMLRGMLQGFMRSGLDLSQLGVNLDRLRDDLRTRAALEVKAFLLLEAIADKEGLTVGDADLDAHYEKLASESGSTKEKIKANFVRTGQVESIQNRIKQDKAYALVLSRASIA